MTTVRKGQAPPKLDREAFGARFRESFQDPAFDPAQDAIARLEAIAWTAYEEGRKAPRTRKAGAGYADPDYDLSVDWIAARERIRSALAVQRDPAGATRVLLVVAAARNDGTCPGEISKTYRLASIARGVIEDAGASCDMLDLSLLVSEPSPPAASVRTTAILSAPPSGGNTDSGEVIERRPCRPSARRLTRLGPVGRLQRWTPRAVRRSGSADDHGRGRRL